MGHWRAKAQYSKHFHITLQEKAFWLLQVHGYAWRIRFITPQPSSHFQRAQSSLGMTYFHGSCMCGSQNIITHENEKWRCLQNFAWRNDSKCDSYACTIWRSFKVWTFLGPLSRQVYSPLFEVFHMYEHSLKLFLVDKLCALFAIAYKKL